MRRYYKRRRALYGQRRGRTFRCDLSRTAVLAAATRTRPVGASPDVVPTTLFSGHGCTPFGRWSLLTPKRAGIGLSLLICQGAAASFTCGPDAFRSKGRRPGSVTAPPVAYRLPTAARASLKAPSARSATGHGYLLSALRVSKRLPVAGVEPAHGSRRTESQTRSVCIPPDRRNLSEFSIVGVVAGVLGCGRSLSADGGSAQKDLVSWIGSALVVTHRGQTLCGHGGAGIDAFSATPALL